MARVSRMRAGDEVFIAGYWCVIRRIDDNRVLHVVGRNGSWSGTARAREVVQVMRDGKRVTA